MKKQTDYQNIKNINNNHDKKHKINIKLSCRFYFSLFILFSVLKSFSQDVIVLKNGDEIKSKVIEVTEDIIKYKKWDNQDGPIYSSNKAQVFMIKYQNGTKDVFNDTKSQTNPPPTDNSSKVIEIAKPYMEKQISTESKGACKLVEFYKQNGVEKNVFGQKLYTLEYRLILETLKDFWKASEDKALGANWYWGNFNTLEKKGDVYSETWTNNYFYFTTGVKIEITGVIDFESTDNGWRMASHTYQNKTAKVLLNVNTANPAKSDFKKPDAPIETVKESYEGDYKEGKKNGKGKMIYVNGNIYEGEWKDDKKNGHGKMVYKDGSSYEGGWKDNKFDGEAVILDNAGKYVGSYLNGLREGKGIIYDKEGNIKGEYNYKNGKLEGHNKFSFEMDDGTFSREGDYKNGELNGTGTYKNIYKDGKVITFNGEFKNSEMYNGTSITINPDGSKYTTEIKNGIVGKSKKRE